MSWRLTEQKLHKIKHGYFKIVNRVGTRALKHSIFRGGVRLLAGSVFFLTPTPCSAIKNPELLKSLSVLFFNLTVVKFNNKVHPIGVFASLRFLSYKENGAVLYQGSKVFAKSPNLKF